MPRISRRSVVAVLVTTLVLAVVSVPAAVAAPPGLAGAHWIWFPEGNPRVSAPEGHRYFHATFTVAPGAGQRRARSSSPRTTPSTCGSTARRSPVRRAVTTRGGRRSPSTCAPALRPGTNTIAVAARNTADRARRDRRPASRSRPPAGSPTSSPARAGRRAGPRRQDWTRPGRGCAARDLGAYGISPWHRDVAAPDLSAASPLRVTQRHGRAPGRPARRRRRPKPRFGWQLAASAPQQRQAAYQLTVSGRAGRGVGQRPGGVGARGRRDLRRARARTAHPLHVAGPGVGRAGPCRWLEPGRTRSRPRPARLDRRLHRAAAGRAGARSGASWIWYPEGDPVAGVPPATRYFRRTVDLAAPAPAPRWWSPATTPPTCG